MQRLEAYSKIWPLRFYFTLKEEKFYEGHKNFLYFLLKYTMKTQSESQRP